MITRLSKSAFAFANSLLAITFVFSRSAAATNKSLGNPLNLAATAQLQWEPGNHSLLLQLSNKSKRAACISEKSFVANDGAVQISNFKGDRVTPFANIGLPRSQDFRGFDYGQAYHFLMPGSASAFSTALTDFKLPPGHYYYSWHIAYYICRDIVNLEQSAEPGLAAQYAFVTSGEFFVPH